MRNSDSISANKTQGWLSPVTLIETYFLTGQNHISLDKTRISNACSITWQVKLQSVSLNTQHRLIQIAFPDLPPPLQKNPKQNTTQKNPNTIPKKPCKVLPVNLQFTFGSPLKFAACKPVANIRQSLEIFQFALWTSQFHWTR